MSVPWWEIVVVALLALGAAAYLVSHFSAGRKRSAAGGCSGDCAHCPFVDNPSGCGDLPLRDTHVAVTDDRD